MVIHCGPCNPIKHVLNYNFFHNTFLLLSQMMRAHPLLCLSISSHGCQAKWHAAILGIFKKDNSNNNNENKDIINSYKNKNI